MIKLIDLLREVSNDLTEGLTSNEQEQYKKALDALSQEKTLEEGVVDTLKKIGMSAAVVAALMAAPNLSSAQKAAVKDAASVTQTATSKVFAGNPQMDQKSFRDKVLAQYKNTNLGFWVDGDEDIRKVQEAIKVYRAWVLNEWKAGKAKIGSKDYKDLSDSEKDELSRSFMDVVPKTEQDGKNGQFTSQFKFPKAFLKDVSSGKIKDLGIEGHTGLQNLIGSMISIDQMNDWNTFVDWMGTHGSQK